MLVRSRAEVKSDETVEKRSLRCALIFLFGVTGYDPCTAIDFAINLSPGLRCSGDGKKGEKEVNMLHPYFFPSLTVNGKLA